MSLSSPSRPIGHNSLCEAWRLRTLGNGWLAADDWHTEAVDAVARAVLPGTPLVEVAVACGRLGRSRAEAGIGIAETIEDLGALFATVGPAGPPLLLVSAVAEGWADEGLARYSQACCEDPLTGLTTMGYLRTRLAEVYREASHLGTSPVATHRLLVVRWPRRPDPWRRMPRAIRLGHDLRSAFPGGDTLADACPGSVIALYMRAATCPRGTRACAVPSGPPVVRKSGWHRCQLC
ncbi:MAG TPA: hypothetical protein VF070_01235 [Streptosporangiaceae bacterium]